jgi:hypothetical protein
MFQIRVVDLSEMLACVVYHSPFILYLFSFRLEKCVNLIQLVCRAHTRTVREISALRVLISNFVKV